MLRSFGATQGKESIKDLDNKKMTKKVLYLTAEPFDYFGCAPFGCAQGRQAQDKFFVFSLTIATILYKYIHIYLWTALRIVVFERGIYGFCTEI